MWLISDIEAATFISIVAFMVAMTLPPALPRVS